MKDINETKLNLQQRMDLLTAEPEFKKFEAKMRKLYDTGISEIRSKAKAELTKFQGGKWLDHWENFDDMEWWSQYGDAAMYDVPFMGEIAKNLNQWIMDDPNLNMKDQPGTDD